MSRFDMDVIRQRWLLRTGGCQVCKAQEAGVMIQHDTWNKYFERREFLCTECIDERLRKKRRRGLKQGDLLCCEWNIFLVKEMINDNPEGW